MSDFLGGHAREEGAQECEAQIFVERARGRKSGCAWCMRLRNLIKYSALIGRATVLSMCVTSWVYVRECTYERAKELGSGARPSRFVKSPPVYYQGMKWCLTSASQIFQNYLLVRCTSFLQSVIPNTMSRKKLFSN